jgi:hypothetical protein
MLQIVVISEVELMPPLGRPDPGTSKGGRKGEVATIGPTTDGGRRGSQPTIRRGPTTKQR